MKHVIVERTFAEPVSLERVRKALDERKACLEFFRVRHLRSAVSPDGLRMICEYEAPDAESVRQVSERAGLPYERVWTAEIIENIGACAVP
jgi:hypothetical protein